MTDHAEISRRLAHAIGYMPEHVLYIGDRVSVNRPWFYNRFPTRLSESWHFFDYRDHRVIWPIAAKYKMFPFYGRGSGKWFKYDDSGTRYEADTPELCVALAVIGRARELHNTGSEFG